MSNNNKCSEDTCEVFELCKWRVGLEACETLSKFTSGTMYVHLVGQKGTEDEEKRIKYCSRFRKEKRDRLFGVRRMLRPIDQY